MISSDHTCLQKDAISSIAYLVRTVLPTLALQVAGQVSVLAVLHDDHQGPYMEKNPKVGRESNEFLLLPHSDVDQVAVSTETRSTDSQLACTSTHLQASYRRPAG